MSNMVTLSDVCSSESSNIAQKDLSDDSGVYPIYGASGFIRNVNFYKQAKSYIAIVKDGAGVGRVSFLPERSSVIGTMQYILPHDNVNTKYLYYVLVNLKLERYFTGATIPHIYFKEYKKEKFPLPPLSVQQKIASILDKVNELTTERKHQLEKIDLLVKSRFVEMFGDPVTNPMGWEHRKLNELGRVGSSKRVFESEFQDEGIPFYRGTEITLLSKGEIISAKYYITEEHYTELRNNTGVPSIGDLLLPSICSGGEIWLVDTDEPFYFKDGRVLWIHVNRQDIVSVYLQFFLRDKLIRDYDQVASGTTFAEMKIFALKEISVLLPPLPLQNRFADFVRAADKSKFALEKAIETASLLQTIYEGASRHVELRVSEITY